MAAPSLIFPQTTTQAPIERDFAAEAVLHRVRAAAMIARDRLAEIEGVRVLGPEVSATPPPACASPSTSATPAATPGRSPATSPRAASSSTPPPAA